RRHARRLRPRPYRGGGGGGAGAGDRLRRRRQRRASRAGRAARPRRRRIGGERVPLRRLHGARGEAAHAQPRHRGAPMSWLDEVPWGKDGLVAVVTQDFSSQRVLTVAWMNREALEKTVRTGEATYWSRSRQRLWRKGEESG